MINIKINYNKVMILIEIHINKLPEAVESLNDLMNKMTKAENQFQNSKFSSLKKISTSRYTKSDIFFYWLSLKDRGINYDINKDIYKETQNMTMSDLEQFFNENIKGRNFNVGIIGDKDNIDRKSVV